nr:MULTISPECIES: hypothetical protein [Flexivirga]
MTVPVTAYVDQVGDLLQAEPEPLRCLDDAQGRDGLVGVYAVSAGATVGPGEQTTALVIPQRLPVDARLACNLPGAKVGACPGQA